MTWRSARLLLRQWQPEDADPFAALNADGEVMRYFPSVLNAEESAHLLAKLQQHWQDHHFGVFALELQAQKKFIGFAGLATVTFAAPFTPCVELAWRIARPFQNQGYATEAALAVCDFAFGTLGLNSLVAFAVPENLPSRRVMEKIGMRHNAAEDFEHPCLPEGHALRRHVLYRLEKS